MQRFVLVLVVGNTGEFQDALPGCLPLIFNRSQNPTILVCPVECSLLQIRAAILLGPARRKEFLNLLIAGPVGMSIWRGAFAGFLIVQKDPDSTNQRMTTFG